MGGHPRVRALTPPRAALRTCTRQRIEGNRRLARIGSRRGREHSIYPDVDSSLDAALSRNQISLPLGLISLEGYFSPGALPSKTSRRTAALSAPLTRNATRRAAFKTGSVSVMRWVCSFSTQLA